METPAQPPPSTSTTGAAAGASPVARDLRSRGANVLSDEFVPPLGEAPSPVLALEAVRAAAEDALATWARGLLADDLLGDRVDALRICEQDWRRIGKVLPPSQCVELFYALCWAPDVFQHHAAVRPKTASARVTGLAAELRDELVKSQSVAGLSQSDRRLAIRLLRALASGGSPGHTGVSRATPPRPKKDTALETFVVRLIVNFLLKFTTKPMYAAVAGLATAATYDPATPDKTVSENSVRKTHALMKRELLGESVPK